MLKNNKENKGKHETDSMKKIIEVTKNCNDEISKVSAYCLENNGEYVFVDLRTTIDVTRLGVNEDMDFSKGLTAIERLYRYQIADCKRFDLDYCKSTRSKYSFKLIDDLYNMLWEINNDETIIDSSETIVSAKQNIPRIFPELRKKQRGRPTTDWELFRSCGNQDLEEFSYGVATIGNYMPVPACEQLILNRFFVERFDLLLHEIKKYYEDGICHKSFTTDFLAWLDLFVDEVGKKSWYIFADKNFFIGSFIDEKLNVVDFNGSAKQISDMLRERSKKMLEIYKDRLKSYAQIVATQN